MMHKKQIINKADEMSKMPEAQWRASLIRFDIPSEDTKNPATETVWGWVEPEDKKKLDKNCSGPMTVVLCSWPMVNYAGRLAYGDEVQVWCNGNHRPVLSNQFVSEYLVDKKDAEDKPEISTVTKTAEDKAYILTMNLRTRMDGWFEAHPLMVFTDKEEVVRVSKALNQLLALFVKQYDSWPCKNVADFRAAMDNSNNESILRIAKSIDKRCEEKKLNAKRDMDWGRSEFVYSEMPRW